MSDKNSLAMHGLSGTGSTALRSKACTMTCARPGTRSTQQRTHGWLQAQPPSSALAGGVAAILRVAVGSLTARSVQEVVTVLDMTQEA